MIRPALVSDLPAIRRLFRDTILTINIRDYSEAQVEGWAGNWQNEERWKENLAIEYFIVAELDDIIAGFASVDDNGLFHLLYVHKDYQRQGIATALLNEIESHCKKKGVALLSANVSITARLFIEKYGYKVVTKQETMYPEGMYVNYKMEKHLIAENASILNVAPKS